MAKNARRSRAGARTRAHSKANYCPVEAIAAQIEGLWTKHDEVEATPPEKMTKGDCEALMRKLFGASETLKDLASLTRAQSLAGALFQIGLANDCADDLRVNQIDEVRQIELSERMARLLYSAAGVIRRELSCSKVDLSVRYMPLSHDPLVVFEKARAL